MAKIDKNAQENIKIYIKNNVKIKLKNVQKKMTKN